MKTKKRALGGSRRPRNPGGPADGARRGSHHDALVALARMAVLDDGLCAGDVIETLNALGFSSVVAEARRMK